VLHPGLLSARRGPVHRDHHDEPEARHQEEPEGAPPAGAVPGHPVQGPLPAGLHPARREVRARPPRPSRSAATADPHARKTRRHPSRGPRFQSRMRRSPLHDLHVRLGARFVDFGGWEMPVQYESVLEEHRSVRRAVGVFDVSHLGRLEVTGPHGTAVLRDLFTNDVTKYEPGKTHYTMLLNEDGGIIDDIVVWRWDEHVYWVMPNAANSDRVRDTLSEHGADVVDLRPTTALLAVQGPGAPRLLEELFGSAPARFRTLEAGGVRMAG